MLTRTGKPMWCTIDNCGKRTRCSGMCESHYCRYIRTGDARKYLPRGLQAVFCIMMTNTDDCILWPLSDDGHGYGCVQYCGRVRRVSHVVLSLSGFPRPTKNHEALHCPIKCSSPSCVNPKHLRWGTSKDNSRDMIISGTKLMGESVGNSKFKESDIIKIRNDRRPNAVIAKEYNCNRRSITAIKRKEIWKHVK